MGITSVEQSRRIIFNVEWTGTVTLWSVRPFQMVVWSKRVLSSKL